MILPTQTPAPVSKSSYGRNRYSYIAAAVIGLAVKQFDYERALLGRSAKSYQGQKRISVNLGLLPYSGPPDQQLGSACYIINLQGSSPCWCLDLLLIPRVACVKTCWPPRWSYVTLNLPYHNDESLGLLLQQSLVPSKRCSWVENNCFSSIATVVGLVAKRDLGHWGKHKNLQGFWWSFGRFSKFGYNSKPSELPALGIEKGSVPAGKILRAERLFLCFVPPDESKSLSAEPWRLSAWSWLLIWFIRKTFYKID